MTFAVGFSPSGKRQLIKLVRRNTIAQLAVDRMIQIVTSDPYNLSREFDIKKLTDEKRGEWRIRSGNYRIRYDIAENRILVHEVFDRTPPVTAPGAAYCGIKIDLTQKGRQGATRENQGTGQTIANGIDLSRIKEKSEVNAARVT